MSKKYFDALDNLLDRPIAFNPSFKKITGSTNAALLLSQAFYWTKRTTNPDGWFWKTREDWMDETGLTEAELDGAREKCRTTGVIEEKLKGVPATLHYRVVKPRVYELLGFQCPQIPENPESGLPENPQIPGNQESGSNGDFNKESENTPKNTSENREIDAEIFKALSELMGGGLNTETTRFVDTWKEKHTLYWILRAVGIAKEKGARSARYVDSILIGWEANGYPKTREERVNDKRRGKQTEADRKATGGNDWLCPDCHAYPCQCEEGDE